MKYNMFVDIDWEVFNMSELLFKQFELTRGKFLEAIEGIEESVLDVQPAGFNNTIHWHIGHVLTSTEQFLFGFPHQSKNLPENYIGLFGYGTKPADWSGQVPTLEELIQQLKEQLTRLIEFPAERLEVKLDEPFLGLHTVGELANLSLFHEAHHLGQIHAMKRMSK